MSTDERVAAVAYVLRDPDVLTPWLRQSKYGRDRSFDEAIAEASVAAADAWDKDHGVVRVGRDLLHAVDGLCSLILYRESEGLSVQTRNDLSDVISRLRALL